MLGIAEHAVHDRAHAALAVLAPRQARELTPDRRLEIGDYLLGQQPGVAERLRTRTLLGSSEPARAWATALAAQLAPLAGAGVCAEIPSAAPQPQRLQDLSALRRRCLPRRANGVHVLQPARAPARLRSPARSSAWRAMLLAGSSLRWSWLSSAQRRRLEKSEAKASKTSSTAATKTGQPSRTRSRSNRRRAQERQHRRGRGDRRKRQAGVLH